MRFVPSEKLKWLAAAVGLLAVASASAKDIDFNRDVRPILSDNCMHCHGPDEKSRKADLRLDVREAAVADLGGYAAIVPGKAAASELIARVLSEDRSET